MKLFFPFFEKHYYLHYFDSAATTLKPIDVINAINYSYMNHTIPFGKSLYKEAEICYDEVIVTLKLKLQFLFNAIEYDVFFGHSVTILLNQLLELCINNLFDKNIKIKVLLPESAHNSFINPLGKYKNIKMFFYNDNNFKDFLDSYLFDIIYIPIIDHITGIEIDYMSVLKYKSKNNNVIIIADASQSAMYQNENLSDYLFDFFLLASHKMYGPDGLAILMISRFFFQKYNNIFKHLSLFFLTSFFAQGSLAYTSFYGFFIALNFLEKNIYYNNEYKIQQHNFINLLHEKIQSNSNLILVSLPNTKTIISFYHKNKYSNDLSIYFSTFDICLRSGDLCSDFEISNFGLVRISFGFYTDLNDIVAIEKVISEI